MQSLPMSTLLMVKKSQLFLEKVGWRCWTCPVPLKVLICFWSRTCLAILYRNGFSCGMRALTIFTLWFLFGMSSTMLFKITLHCKVFLAMLALYTRGGGGYSDLGWVRMCGPEFQLLPYSKTWPLANSQPISKPHFSTATHVKTSQCHLPPYKKTFV